MLEPILSSGTEGIDDPAAVVNCINILIDNYFNDELAENKVSILETLSYCSTSLTNILSHNQDTVEKCVTTLFFWGLKFKISKKNGKEDIRNFELYSDVTSEFICLLSSNMRKRTIINILQIISKLSANTSVIIEKSLLRSESDLKISQKNIPFTLVTCLEILSRILNRSFINIPGLIYFMNDVLQFNNTIIKILTLRCIERIIPLTIDESIIEVRLLIDFYQKAKIQNIFSDLNEESYKEIDWCLHRSYKRATSKLNKNYSVILGRELISFVSSIEKGYSFRKFIDDVLTQVYEYIKADVSCINMISDLINKKFEVFHKSEVFIEICTFLGQHKQSFLSTLQKNYLNNTECLPSLIKIDPSFVIPDEMCENLPAKIFLNVCSTMKTGFNQTFVDRLNSEFSKEDAQIKAKNLIELANFLPVDIVHNNFRCEALPLIFSKHPEALDKFIEEWERFSVKSGSLPFIALLAKRANKKKDSNFDGIKDYLRSNINDYKLWEQKEVREVIPLVFSKTEVLNIFKEYILKTEIQNIPNEVGDFFLSCKQVAPDFLTFLLRSFLQDQAKMQEMAYSLSSAYMLLNRSAQNLRNIYFYNRYDNSYILYEISKIDQGNFSKLMKLIFQTPKATLSLIQNELIPVLAKREDIDCINDVFNEMKSEEITDTTKLIRSRWADISTYLFTRFDNTKIISCFTFLTTQIVKGESTTNLCEEAFIDLESMFILNLGDEDEEIVKRTRNGMKLICNIVRKTKKDESYERMFWMENIVKVTYDFGKIMLSKCSAQMKQAIRAMTVSLKHLTKDLDVIYSKILPMVEIGMSDPEVKPECFKFYETFLNCLSTNSPVIKDVFGNIVAQLLPNFKEYPEETLKILKLLIIERESQVSSCFFLIAMVKELFIYPELKEIKETVVSIVSSYTWTELAKMLMDSIPGSPQHLQLLIVEQLVEIFKKNAKSLNQFIYSDKLCVIIWKALVQSRSEEFQIQSGRLLAIISPQLSTNEHLILNNGLEKKDASRVMREIVSDYLVHVFEDFQKFSSHDAVSCAIQIILKELGCSSEETTVTHSSRRKSHAATNRGDQNWALFDPKVQAVIEKFKRTAYSPKKQEIISTPVFLQLSKKEKWLPNFTAALLQVECDSTERQQYAHQLKCISFVLTHVPQICTFLLPYLCYWQRLNASFHSVFRSEFHALLNSLEDSSSERHDNARIFMQLMFNIFDKIAQFSIYPSDNHCFSSAAYFDIATDDEISKAAYSCQLYTHALMYLELAIRNDWSDSQRDKRVLDERRQKQMKQIYKHLNEPDGLEALRRLRPKNAIRDETLSVAEMKVLSSSASSSLNESSGIGFFNKMLKSGRYERTLSDALQYRNVIGGDRRIDAIIARSATRLFKWDAIPDVKEPKAYTMFSPVVDRKQQILDSTDISIASALRYLKQREFTLFDEVIQKARKDLAEPLHQDSSVSFDRMVPTLIDFHILEELNDFSSQLKKNKGPKIESWKRWTDETQISSDESERLIGIHCAMLKIAYKDSQKLKKEIANQWLELAKVCRKSGELFRAQMACSRASQWFMGPATTIESAKICLAQHETTQAISIVSSCINPSSNNFGKATFLRAQWSANTKNMSADELVKEYSKAAETIENAGKAYYALASLADQRVTSYLKYLEQVKTEGTKRSSTKFFDGNTKPAAITEFLKNQVPLALENYKESIVLAPQYSHEVVPRILQLYFDIGRYFTSSSDEQETQLISEKIKKLSPSQKEQILNAMTSVIIDCQRKVKSAVWLNSITQLISRVEQPPKLEQHLFEFIRIALQDYPHPTFWHLMSVKHSESTQSKKQKFATIINKVTNSLPSDRLKKFTEILNKFERITDGLIKLAKANPGSSRLKQAFASTICLPLVQACNGCNVLMPLSRTLMIRHSEEAFNDSSKFECSPSIAQMEDDISIFSSLQRPKKINLKGSDGKSYHFLCKKDDDLRKDMRMMEFASFINRVLSRDRRCRERSLSIVTFAVVCLDEQCGILEWAENTRSFRSIIDDLYKQHRIGLSRNKICEYFCENENGRNATNLAEKKIKNFKTKILPEYPPLLHEWFIKRFVTPARWFQSRLKFARSTSVWSMVGYIVGLGDRHTENILFNEVTGGVVHVDFCCMFDKAKSLPTPECVPFRLTQNFVDGMGVLGTDGPFSECSTFVLDSLRQKKQKLVSVLQTFVHDPLLEWKKGNQSPMKTAKLMLEEVERRLSGFAEDKSTFQSPECAVRALIDQATDSNNLALMYIGWQPFL